MREWKGHSYEKTSILGDYLPAFAQATQRAPNRVYVDAFAGDPRNIIKGTDREFPGSPELALRASPPFTHLRFFEKNSGRAQRLRELATRDRVSGVQVVEGDCNEEMAGVLRGLPVQAPTFAFLDPDGMELRWKTIRAKVHGTELRESDSVDRRQPGHPAGHQQRGPELRRLGVYAECSVRSLLFGRMRMLLCLRGRVM